jgi:hypothetical protein
MPRSTTDSAGTSGSGTPFSTPRPGRSRCARRRHFITTRRRGKLRVQRLHLGQQMAQVLAVHAARAGAAKAGAGGSGSVASASTPAPRRASRAGWPRRAQAGWPLPPRRPRRRSNSSAV